MSRSSNMARLGILILALITTVAPISIALTHVENTCAKEAVLHLSRDDVPDGAKCKSIIDLGCVCSESTGEAFLRSLGDYVKDGRGECREQYFAEIQAYTCAYCLVNDLVPPKACRKAFVRIVPAESNVQ